MVAAPRGPSPVPARESAAVCRQLTQGQAGRWRVREAGEGGGGERHRVGGRVKGAGGLLGVPWHEEPWGGLGGEEEGP